MKKNLFFVSRQNYFPDGNLVIEVAQGGSNYANPDMLVEKYAGEGVEYHTMTDAVKAAIEVAKSWQKDSDEPIEIAVGCTYGNTMPFEGEELTEEVFANLIEKANEFDDNLPKCDHCGEIIEGERYGNDNTIHLGGEDSYPFCSSNCAQMNYDNWCAENKEEEEEIIEE